MKVELIVPCYNESAVLQMFYDEAFDKFIQYARNQGILYS